MSLDALSRRVAKVFTSPRLWGEVVTYYPRGDEQNGVELKAYVSRAEAEVRPEDTLLQLPEVALYLLDDSENGITEHHESDTVLLQVREREAARVVRVPNVVSLVDGMFILEVTA